MTMNYNRMVKGASILCLFGLSFGSNQALGASFSGNSSNASINSVIRPTVTPNSRPQSDPVPVVEAPVANPPAPQLVAAPRDEDEVLQKAARN